MKKYISVSFYFLLCLSLNLVNPFLNINPCFAETPSSVIAQNSSSNSTGTESQTGEALDKSFQFPDYLIKEAKELESTFRKETGSLSEEEIHKASNRANEAYKKQDWPVASLEYSRVLGKHPEKREFWIRLSLSSHQKNLNENNYLIEQIARKAAVQAYFLAKTPDEQAEALLVYGNTFNPSDDYEYPFYQATLEYARYLSDIAKLKQNNKDLTAIMDFRYLKPRVNTDTTPPSVCFLFSHPIQTKNIQLSDYVTVSPQIDANIKANGRELCISPMEFGKTYDVILKAGLLDEVGEKLKKEEKISIKVRDQDSRLSFNNKAYILRKDENGSIPLTGVNVDRVSIKILRVSERALNYVVGQSQEFLTRLWDYRIEQLGNETGEVLYSGEMDFSKEKNKTVTKQVPFSEVVKKPEPGVYIVQAEEQNVLGNKASATQWLIVSDLALTTFTESNGAITVNVRSLKSADPLSNIELRLIAHNNSILDTQKSNREGMVLFEPSVATGKGGNRPLMILAYGPKGEFSFISLDLPALDLSDRGIAGRVTPGPLDAFVYTEQGVYRPGSIVHVNALLRNEKGLLAPKIPLIFKVLRSDETIVKTQSVTGNELGLYSMEIPLSTSARTGQWTLLAFADPKQDPIGRCQFSVEDFVPSRIAVTLQSKDTLLSNKEPVKIEVEARYLFGFPASGLSGEGTVNVRPRANPYPAHRDYVFGLEDDTFQNQRSQQVIPPLDKEGKTEFSVQLEKLPETSKPLEAVIRVSLASQGGRPEIGTLTLPVQTTPILLGIKATFKDRVISENETEAKFQVIAIDNAGKLLPISDLQYELYEENLNYTWYRPDNFTAWQYKTIIDDHFLQSGVLTISDAKPESINLSIPNWGQYRLVIKDPKTGASSSYRFQKGWLAFGNGIDSPDKLKLRVNKPLVSLDEKLELQIDSPFDGQALLTIANDRILETRNITLSKSPNANRVQLTANENWGVGVYCMVSAIRPLGDGKDAKTQNPNFLPKRAIGLVWLGINPGARTLEVQFDVPKEVKPRQTIEIPVQVTRQDGKGLSSPLQMTVAAVDEGILKLTDFAIPKPQQYFLGQRTLGIEQRDLYGRLIDPIPGEVGVLRQGGDSGLLSRNMQALSKRSFKIVSLYQGLVILDKQGKGKISLDLPDFNGSLRLMAVAFDEKRFGSGEANVLVRDPVVLEGVLPRFLAPGDESTFSLSLHNVSGLPGQYQVLVKTEGELKLKSTSEKSENKTEKTLDVNLEKEGKVELQIPLQAVGMGEGKIIVSLKGPAGAAEKSLTISSSYDISIRSGNPYMSWSLSYLLKSLVCYRMEETFQDYLPGSEQMMLSVSSTVPWDIGGLSQLLLKYPYGCIEQITSKGMGALAFLGNAKPEDAKDNKQIEMVNQTLAILSEKQLSNGLYNLWNEAGGSGDIFLSSYVMDFYLRAKSAGYGIPEFSLSRGLEGLKQIIDRPGELKSDDLSGLAYAVYVGTKADQLSSGNLRYFYDQYFEQLDNPFARALVANALAQKGENDRAREAFNHLFIQKNGVNTVGPFGSPLRNQAGLLCLSLEALKINPALKEASLIAERAMKEMQTVLDKPSDKVSSNALLSTQELAWILLASNSLNAQGNSEPIQILVQDNLQKTDNKVLQLPIIMEDWKQGLSLCNQGKNDLFVNVNLTALPKENPKAESKGISLLSYYYDLEGNPIDPSSVKQGQQMLVLIKGDAQKSQNAENLSQNIPAQQLLLVDLLAAGFEIENARIHSDNKPYDWLPDNLSKTEFSEARDDRYVAALKLDEKNPSFQVAYQVRAVTKGQYLKPGIFVQDMYTPNLYARTEAKTIEVLGPKE